MAVKIDIWEMSEEVEPLELDVFWSLIEKSKLISMQERINHHEALGQILSLGSLTEIARFKNRFSALSSAANTDHVYAIIGGSDDGFRDGISSLISLGREPYEQLLSRPEAFSGLISEYEVFEYASHYAFEEPTRSTLQALALARHEQEVLGKSVLDPRVEKHGPRV